MSDWTFDIGPHLVAAKLEGPHQTQVDLYLDEDGDMEVQIEAGSGYGREHLTAYIPKRVLLRLLDGRGWKVATPSEGKAP